MAMSGNLRISASLKPPPHQHPNRISLPSSSSKVEFMGFTNNGAIPLESRKCPGMAIFRENERGRMKLLAKNTGECDFLQNSAGQEIESFLLNAINMSFLYRLNLAWKILFPSQASRRSSNARIAKQRLKMILFSDRCAVSDEAKRKIVNNIIHALSDFVEIESEERVHLNVFTDTDLGTIYSVSVPVRRVKPEYQDMDEVGAITNMEHRDTLDGSVDVRFDFYIPD